MSVFEARGPHAVTTHTLRLYTDDDTQPFACDVWAPTATDTASSLVFFSHGFGGHRRQSSFLLSHLGSHGFVVASPDHRGPALPALMAMSMQAKARGEAVGPALVFGDLPKSRPQELLALLSPLREELADKGIPLATTLAVVGHSFGAYAGLVAAARNRDIASVVALAPAGGRGPVHVPAFSTELALSQLGHVQTLYLAAERDTLVPLSGVEGLFAATAGVTRLHVLEGADHVHFCDHVAQAQDFLRAATSIPELARSLGTAPPFAQLLDEASAHRAICGEVTAHLYASLRDDAAARVYLDTPSPPVANLAPGARSLRQ